MSDQVRGVLLGRSGGACEITLPGCSSWGTDPAHRKSVKLGGRNGSAAAAHNAPSNVLWACRACHDWCHQHPAEAYSRGLMLREHQTPVDEPVLYRTRWVHLDDLGGVTDVREAAA